MTGAQRVAKRRAALRAQGLRPKTIWVPDRNSEAYKEQARLDVAALHAWHNAHSEVMDWVDAMTADVLASLPEEDFDY